MNAIGLVCLGLAVVLAVGFLIAIVAGVVIIRHLNQPISKGDDYNPRL